RWDKFSKKLKAIDDLSNYLKKKRQAGKSFWQMIKHDDDPVRQFIAEDQTVNDMDINENVIDAVVIDSIYEGYLERQAKHIAGFKNLENVKLSERIDYNAVAHLSNEGRSKLSKFRPDNLAQASRVGGVTPADITVLRIYLKAKQQQ
ncbi:MAG: hypothetical protein KAS23_03275, partial [Anaerohalosphaera sp.]|nr:hypothetical protein [Anaerohalosphaera sp.]